MENKTAENGECRVHGRRSRSGDRALISMLLASLFFMTWHVWVTRAVPDVSQAFPVRFANELQDLLFGRRGVLAELWEVLPYFLIGILIAGYLRTYKVAVKLQATLRRYGVASVFLASFVGIITPLCACGTVTTALSLLMAGLPLAPVMALMVTSPLLSPSTYLLTLNDLGPEWTVVRTVAAFAMGVIAGLVTHFLSRYDGFKKKDILIEGALVRGDFHDEDYPDERLRCNCRRNFGNRVAVRTGNKFLVFLAKTSEMLWVVGKYVIVGVTIGAVVERYLPSGWIYRFFGGNSPLNIVWVTLASVPMFVHQISASSIVHHIKGALDGAIDGGAALAFMIGGPVTAVPTMVMFWSFFKKRVFVLYMAICIVGTVLVSYGFQWLLFVPGADLGNPLLRGVGTLPGVSSRVLAKHNADVRTALAVSGKAVLATYTNESEGGAPVVFDGSRARFAAASADTADTGRYVLNVAGLLAQDGSDGSGKRILVYDLDAGEGAPLLSPGLLARLRASGFSVEVAGRRDIPELTEPLLARYGQLWLFFGTNAEARLSDAELRRIEERPADRGGTLVVPEPPGAADAPSLEANRLGSHYGVSFSGPVQSPKTLRVSVAADLLDAASQWLGQALKLVKKA